MKQYRLVDNIFGWVAFIIAAFTYCSTIEPTASFWDCPEFITTAYKQEIGHPPGAPFFMLLGNFFTHFASDTQVAKMVNTMSAPLSAVCIMFLFWTITHLARRLVISDWKELTTSKLIAIEASGMVAHSSTPSAIPSGSQLSRVRFMRSLLPLPLWYSGSS